MYIFYFIFYDHHFFCLSSLDLFKPFIFKGGFSRPRLNIILNCVNLPLKLNRKLLFFLLGEQCLQSGHLKGRFVSTLVANNSPSSFVPFALSFSAHQDARSRPRYTCPWPTGSYLGSSCPGDYSPSPGHICIIYLL